MMNILFELALPRDIVNEIHAYLTLLYHQEIKTYFNSTLAPQIHTSHTNKSTPPSREVIERAEAQLKQIFQSLHLSINLLHYLGANRTLFRFAKTLEGFPYLQRFVRDIYIEFHRYCRTNPLLVLNNDPDTRSSYTFMIGNRYPFLVECRFKYYTEILYFLHQRKDVLLEYIIAHDLPAPDGFGEESLSDIMFLYFCYGMDPTIDYYDLP